MVDLVQIEETIDELINTAPTTFETCEHLAHLKITRDLLRDRLNISRCGFDEVKGSSM